MNNFFKITSGAIRVTDPCYTMGADAQCAGTIENVKNGTWVANVGEEGGRIGILMAMHEDHIADKLVSFEEENLVPFSVGVDSGQAGFFDLKEYEKVSLQDDSLEDWLVWRDAEFYSKCAELTLGKEQWGCLEFGVVSSTGWGDGSYPCYFAKNTQGEVVGLTIHYIDEDEEDREEY